MGLDNSAARPATPQDLQDLLQAVRAEFPKHLYPWPAHVALTARDFVDPPQRGRASSGGGWPRFGRSRRPLAGSTEGELLYAVGDVHGRLDLLQALVSLITEDAAGRAHVVVFCGDYVDRGPDSARVLEWLLCLRDHLGERLRLLKGNHEQAFLRFIDDPASGAAWIETFGGAATLGSYGVTAPPAEAPPQALAAARDHLLANMPAAHLRLLQGLELMVVRGDYAFVHAGIAPETPLAEQTEGDLLWARDRFLEAPGPFEKIIVHGHTWTQDRPTLLSHRIGVDTGAYDTGVLSAVRLEDGAREVIQALDAAASRRRTAGRAPSRPLLVSRPPDYAHDPAEEVRSIFTAPALNLTRCASDE